MAKNKLPFAKGAFTHRLPMFSGVNYQFWKICTKFFIDSIDQGIWDAIMNGPCTPKHVIDNKQVNKPWNQWTWEERKCAQCDCSTKNIITSFIEHGRVL